MTPIGRHLLLECWGCPSQILSDPETLQSALAQAVQAAGATVIKAQFHRFAQGGVSGVILLAESHISAHTWPECDYAALDFYTCGAADPLLAKDLLLERLKPDHWEALEIARGEREGFRELMRDSGAKRDL